MNHLIYYFINFILFMVASNCNKLTEARNITTIKTTNSYTVSNKDKLGSSNNFNNNPPVDKIQRSKTIWHFKDTYLNNIAIPHAPLPTLGHVTPMPVWWSSSPVFYRVDAISLTTHIYGPTNYILNDAINRFRSHLCKCSGLSNIGSNGPDTSMLNSLSEKNYVNSMVRGYSKDNWHFQQNRSGEPLKKWPDVPDVNSWFRLRLPTISKKSINCLSNNKSIICLNIHIKTIGNAWPDLNMKENYSLLVTPNSIELHADEIWGILHSLETLSQLMWCSSDDSMVFLNRTYIEDGPRFPHRGLMMDTSRHFIAKRIILTNIEAMAYHKLNVFHWHLSDDQSFPFQSQTFPELSKNAAYRDEAVYTPTDVREIIEFARVRGIRVIPEFDLPGHVRSWAYSHPEIISKCYEHGKLTPYFGPVDPSNPDTYKLLSAFFTEIAQTFTDLYIHIGFDEVEVKCWEKNPSIVQFMKENNINFANELLKHFHIKLQNLISDAGASASTGGRQRHFVVWEEAYEKGLKIDDRTIIELWKSRIPSPAMSGFKTILATCWYLDHITAQVDWMKFYLCDPLLYEYDQNFGISQMSINSNGDEIFPNGAWIKNMIGAETCMWAEFQSDDTILQRIWPITTATAERFWSPKEVRKIDEATPRFEEQRCRLIKRGIPTGVLSGPGDCPNRKVVKPVNPQLNLNTPMFISSNSSLLTNVFFITAFFLGLLVGTVAGDYAITFLKRCRLRARHPYYIIHILIIICLIGFVCLFLYSIDYNLVHT